MAQSFLEKLISGDIRAIVQLVFILLIIYVIVKRYMEIPEAFRGIINLMFTVGVFVFVYTIFTNPERAVATFNSVVDATVSIFESLFSDDKTSKKEDKNAFYY